MMANPTKLSDWLPILQHPEVGERICKAAGVVSVMENGLGETEVWLNDEGWGGCGHEILDASAQAALAFGTLAVLADHTDYTVELEVVPGFARVWVMANEDDARLTMFTGGDLPAAVLAAAHRVWCE